MNFDFNIEHLSGNSNHPHTNTRLNKEVKARIDELREFDIVHSYLMSLIPSVGKVGEQSNVGTIVTLNAYRGICAKNDLRYRGEKKCREKSISKCLECITHSGYKNNENGYLYQTASQLFSLRLVRSGEHRISSIDGFHALSRHVKESYVGFDYEGEKIDVIPNILDPRFEINHRSKFQEPFRLLYVGGLKESKGADRLIDIFSLILAKSSKEVELTIIGDGELASYLQTRIERENLSSIVDLRGRVPNYKLPQVYANHDLFVYPGRWDEPFGRVFLEAMATGTPIVSTDVGSVKDIIGKSGICTDQSNQAMADAIIPILDQGCLSEFSSECKRQIEHYRVDKVIPRFETLYVNATS